MGECPKSASMLCFTVHTPTMSSGKRLGGDCFTKDRFSSILPNVQRVLHTAQGELNRLQIKHGKGLKLKPMEILSSRVAQTDKLGETQHWSANGFFTHLSLLERLVSKGEEATAAQSWINALFFRVAAILPAGNHMVLKLERAESPIPLTDVPGTMNWIALVTPSKVAAEGFTFMPLIPGLMEDSNASILFVSERRDNKSANIQSTVCDMYKWARTRGENIIRGALTDGESWIFLILKLDANGGGVWMRTDEIGIKDSFSKLSEFELALIPGILAHWVMHSHKDLEDGDYFEITAD
ncbi:hypothetical protein D9619_002642 [Psilocybe cf. subviscida]|uniref:Uncharacterized protein n=1 Tax=Psilocybe cf. subviscida TaxID=2480587 RepID=A0A8H5AY42_9AGAR|nr:hypothetical protein D9619_002642 [Psilocybe cf. subviscida]